MKFIKILKANEVPNRVLELLQESYQENCKPLAYLSTRGGKTEIVISKDKFGINITTYIDGKSQSSDNSISDLDSHWTKYYSNDINKEFGQPLYKLIWSDPSLDTSIFTKMKKESAIQQPNKPKPTTTLPDNMQWAWDPEAADWVAVLKDNDNTTPPLYDPNNQNVVNQTTNYMSTVKSGCLSKFLDGPQYSKEIKIEAGLIKEGLVKYAGFDFNRGTKYAITTKGLEVLRRASEQEHNEALNKREKLAYLFGFNTDEISTLDTTGKVIKSDELSKCEWCGEEFDESELEDTELGKVCYRCKKGIESKEGPMNNKNISEAKQYLEKYLLENPELFKYQYGKDNVEEVLKELIEENPNWYKKFSSKKWTICEADGTPLGKVTASSELDAKVKFGIEHPQYADSQSISAKEINAQYEQTTNTKEPYPNPSETPHDNIVLENHDGWVNTADKHQYTEEEKRLLPLFKLTNDYIAKGKIENISDLVEEDNVNMFIGEASVINELEHKVKDLGFYCESIEQANTTSQGLVYALKIFLK